jgi:hypothetical protein
MEFCRDDLALSIGLPNRNLLMWLTSKKTRKIIFQG